MGINGFPTNFPPQRAPIIDQATGQFTMDGRYLLLALFNRSGEGDGFPTIALGLMAQGIDQSSAILMGSDWNEFDTVAAGTGAVIPIMGAGGDIIVWNFGASPLSIYPSPVAAPNQPIQIDALGVNQPYMLAAGKMQWLRQISPTQIRSTQLG